jgi:hypothetical protein|tara:strand:- start:276 stop:509 length:234 start_codon:yes stop_codon:yes gene_type:complete
MTTVIDFTLAFLSRRKVVKVKCAQKPHEDRYVKITGSHLPQPLSFMSLAHADAWLKSEGYRWVVGSNGFWAKEFLNV